MGVKCERATGTHTPSFPLASLYTLLDVKVDRLLGFGDEIGLLLSIRNMTTIRSDFETMTSNYRLP